MVPLVGNICIIGTNLITNATIGKEIGANGKNGNTIGTNGTNVTNRCYHWENPEHTHYMLRVISVHCASTISENTLGSDSTVVVTIMTIVKIETFRRFIDLLDSSPNK